MSAEKKQPEQPEQETTQDQMADAQSQQPENEGDEQAAEAQSEELTEQQRLQAELEAVQAKADENWDKLLRSQAELDNVRKRAQRDIENARKYALEGIANELLPVRDSLELGLDAINKEDATVQSAKDGLQLIHQMLAKLMEQHGISAVDPAGEAFNPEKHQAMSMQETTEQPANTVLSVMQKGYTLNDRLLRPAMVVVAKAPTQAQQGTEQTDKNNADSATGEKSA